MKSVRLLIIIITVLFATGAGQMARAQAKVQDAVVKAHLFYPTYMISLPAADMAERFGLSHSIGMGFAYKTTHNWFVGAEGNFIFRDGVKRPGSYLSGIMTGDGFVIDQSGVFANVMLLERGFSVMAKAGRLFPLGKPNPNSGLLLQLGAGMLQHKIRIDVQGNSVPQLSAEYKKGYDHLCSGPAATQFIGYQYLSGNKKINFLVGFEFLEAYTTSRRLYYFNDMQYAAEKRFDMLNSLKIAWCLPVYGKPGRQFYYN